MPGAEPRARPVHAVVRPRPAPFHLASGGVDVHFPLLLVVLAGLRHPAAGSGEPRTPAAAGNPAASADFPTPSRFDIVCVGDQRTRSAKVLNMSICFVRRGFEGCCGGIQPRVVETCLVGDAKSDGENRLGSTSWHIHYSQRNCRRPRLQQYYCCTWHGEYFEVRVYVISLRKYWCAHSTNTALPVSPKLLLFRDTLFKRT